MKILLNDVGKRYNQEWIFRGINTEFQSGKSYAILGSNGSGKSTLLQLIAGNQLQSQGNISYAHNNQVVDPESIFRYISIAAPYLELIEEYTLKEIIAFHAQFKPFFKAYSPSQIAEITELEKSANKELKYFSSGMKQRLRLALAILSDTPILLLDEPTSNLDKRAMNWYSTLVQQHLSERIVIVSSNHQQMEYDFCSAKIEIDAYKIAKV